MMDWSLLFFLNSFLLGVDLAMDAFSVSLANGLNEPRMKPSRMSAVAGVYAGFQFAMPLIGWLCVRTVAKVFTAFQRLIPWIALALLVYIGGKMLYDGLHPEEEASEAPHLGTGTLFMQGVATSIDALSVGFTISDYGLVMALVCALLIAVVTFALCLGGLFIGKKFGTRLAGKASVLGGLILIAIGLEIFLRGILA